MAKRNKRSSASPAVGQRIEEFAEDLGRIFGQAESKATAWMNQRSTILEQLTAVRDKASGLIQSLTGESAGRGRGGRKGGRRKRSVKLSAAGRAAISAAQKLRWAKYNAAKSAKKK